MRKSKFRKLKVLAVWTVISLLMQVGALYFLEREIKGDPVSADPIKQPVVVNQSAVLPTAEATNLQASYAKEYLAYTDQTGLKVLNVKTSQVVFSEVNPKKGEILGYHWLPDRNTLLFVSSMPNPNPKPADVKPKVETVEKEDPLTGKSVVTTKETPTVTAYNPQLTELYAVDFADPDQDTKPDKRLARKLDNFPADGEIENIDLSTYTNLIYIQAKTPTQHLVYEIDVMKNMRTVQRTGEKISDIVASDKMGTLYMQSNLAGIDQIVAVKHSSREQLIRGSQYVLLGVQDGKVFVGDVEGDKLIKIISMPDTSSQDKVSTSTSVEWHGSIPWHNYQAIIGPENYWVLYNQQQAVTIQNGKVKDVEFTAQDNYLTPDGREIIEVNPLGSDSLKVAIRPL